MLNNNAQHPLYPLTVLAASRPVRCFWRGDRATAMAFSAQLVSAVPGVLLGRGPLAQVAQLVEHVTENHGVGCSIHPLGTSKINYLAHFGQIEKILRNHIVSTL